MREPEAGQRRRKRNTVVGEDLGVFELDFQKFERKNGFLRLDKPKRTV